MSNLSPTNSRETFFDVQTWHISCNYCELNDKVQRFTQQSQVLFDLVGMNHWCSWCLMTTQCTVVPIIKNSCLFTKHSIVDKNPPETAIYISFVAHLTDSCLVWVRGAVIYDCFSHALKGFRLPSKIYHFSTYYIVRMTVSANCCN